MSIGIGNSTSHAVVTVSGELLLYENRGDVNLKANIPLKLCEVSLVPHEKLFIFRVEQKFEDNIAAKMSLMLDLAEKKEQGVKTNDQGSPENNSGNPKNPNPNSQGNDKNSTLTGKNNKPDDTNNGFYSSFVSAIKNIKDKTLSSFTTSMSFPFNLGRSRSWTFICLDDVQLGTWVEICQRFADVRDYKHVMSAFRDKQQELAKKGDLTGGFTLKSHREKHVAWERTFSEASDEGMVFDFTANSSDGSDTSNRTYSANPDIATIPNTGRYSTNFVLSHITPPSRLDAGRNRDGFAVKSGRSRHHDHSLPRQDSMNRNEKLALDGTTQHGVTGRRTSSNQRTSSTQRVSSKHSVGSRSRSRQRQRANEQSSHGDDDPMSLVHHLNNLLETSRDGKSGVPTDNGNSSFLNDDSYSEMPEYDDKYSNDVFNLSTHTLTPNQYHSDQENGDSLVKYDGIPEYDFSRRSFSENPLNSHSQNGYSRAYESFDRLSPPLNTSNELASYDDRIFNVNALISDDYNPGMTGKDGYVGNRLSHGAAGHDSIRTLDSLNLSSSHDHHTSVDTPSYHPYSPIDHLNAVHPVENDIKSLRAQYRRVFMLDEAAEDAVENDSDES